MLRGTGRPHTVDYNTQKPPWSGTKACGWRRVARRQQRCGL